MKVKLDVIMAVQYMFPLVSYHVLLLGRMSKFQDYVNANANANAM